MHFHTSNRLLSTIIIPGYIRLSVENAKAMPVFTQADQQAAQVIDRRELLVSSLPRHSNLLVQFDQLTIPIERQLIKDCLGLIHNPSPFFRQILVQLAQLSSHQTATKNQATIWSPVIVCGPGRIRTCDQTVMSRSL
jgi:hypothetical protein